MPISGVVIGTARPSLIVKAVSGMKKNKGEAGAWGILKGIQFPAPMHISGTATFGRSMQVGVTENFVEGSPASPSLELKVPGFWRFRWVVQPGARSVTVLTKQVANVAPYPSMVVKANSAVGLASDLTVSGTAGGGWTTCGPASFTCTASGVLWVELHNNCVTVAQSSAFFDHLIFQ